MVVGVELQLVVLAPRYKNINRRTPNLAAHAQPKDVFEKQPRRSEA